MNFLDSRDPTTLSSVLFALELVERQLGQDRTNLLLDGSERLVDKRVNSVFLLEVQTGPDEQEQEANKQQRSGLEPLAQQRSHEQSGGGLSYTLLIELGLV